MHGGIERSYLVRVPDRLDQHDGRIPLVPVLHGGGGNAFNAERMTGFTEKALKEGFIVVYPEGTGRLKHKFLTWNAGHCCGFAMNKHIYDVGFINDLIDKLIKDYPIDSKRVYITGISNGGMMTHRLGIELSSRIAAIAPVVATFFGDEKTPEHPVSAIMLNGVLDSSVAPQGGPPGGRFSDSWDGTTTKPAVEQAAFWAKTNGCSTTPRSSDHPAFSLSQYNCPANLDVEIYLIKDSGHAWPGGQKGRLRGDNPSSSISATDIIWDFFKTHEQASGTITK
ncbi:MAG: polyhydroxybutyrate depolymerase [Desulfobacterium sp.]|nr:polyhydroxybutyrate depolymerase [Desulfobacterium sp.]